MEDQEVPEARQASEPTLLFHMEVASVAPPPLAIVMPEVAGVLQEGLVQEIMECPGLLEPVDPEEGEMEASPELQVCYLLA
jgi:hypothetical protein